MLVLLQDALTQTWIFGLSSKQRQGQGSFDVIMTVDGWGHASKDLQIQEKCLLKPGQNISV